MPELHVTMAKTSVHWEPCVVPVTCIVRVKHNQILKLKTLCELEVVKLRAMIKISDWVGTANL